MNNQTKTKNFTFRLGEIVFYTKIELIELCESFFSVMFFFMTLVEEGWRKAAGNGYRENIM